MAENNAVGRLTVDFNNEPAAQGLDKFDKKVKQVTDSVQKEAGEAQQALDSLGTTSQTVGKQTSKAADQVVSASKKRSGVQTELAKKERQLAAIEARALEERRNLQVKHVEWGKRQVGVVEAIGRRDAELEQAKRATIGFREEQRRRTKELELGLRERSSVMKRAVSTDVQSAREMQQVLNRTIGLPGNVRPGVMLAAGYPTAQRRRSAMIGLGRMTPTEALITQLEERFSPAEAAYLVGKGPLPVSFGARDVLGERLQKQTERLRKQQEKVAQFAAQQASPWYEIGWEAKLQRRSASDIVFERINRGAARANLLSQMQAASASGGSAYQVWQKAMGQSIARANASSAAYFAQQNIAAQTVASRGGGGFFGQGGLGRRLLGGGGGGLVGGFASGLLGGLGVGVGGYAAARLAESALEASKTSVAYERQRVAAENLSGSQAQLNALLEAYQRASGGAIDKATTLGNVTRLLATGYAESVPEVERFVKATRGASIALGRPQDYIVQETQLAISNTSVKRLDQIGLGIVEVQQRIEKLRASNRGWSREQAFQEAVLGLLEEKYGKLTDTLEGQKTGVEKLTAAWNDWVLAAGKDISGPLNKTADALARMFGYFANVSEASRQLREGTFRPGTKGMTIAQEVGLRATQNAAKTQRRYARQSDRLGISWLYGQMTGQSQSAIRAQRLLNYPFALTPSFEIPQSYDFPSQSAPTGPLAKYDDEQKKVLRASHAASLELERNYNRSRLEEIRKYETQRASVVRDYSKQIVREEEDFARQRARSLRDYERSIVDMMRDAQDKEKEMREDLDNQIADYQEDLADKLAEIREDSEDRVTEIQEKYDEEREKSEKEHRERLLSAAGRLDAIAIFEEKRRWALENQEREKSHKEALDDEKDSLDERVEDAEKANSKQIQRAREAYEEALEDQRKANEKRLEEMNADRERQLADENEDRAIRKARAAEDHAEQLGELDQEHQETLTRLRTEAEENRQALVTALEADLAEIDLYIEGYSERMKKKDEAIEKWFDRILEKLEKIIKEPEGREMYPGGPIQEFASGGPVYRSGPAMLHAGEYVLNRDVVNSMASSSYMNSSYDYRSVTVHPGAIQVYGASGQSVDDIGRVVRAELIAALTEVQ